MSGATVSDQNEGEPNGPVVQSIAIGFRVLYIATLLLAAGWLISGLRQVPPDSQAILTRFGRIVAVRQSGLASAWPRPIGAIELVPGADRQLAQKIAAGAPSPGLEDEYTKAAGMVIPPDAGSFLTGDGGAVLLQATLYYQVSDAAAYFLARAHVAPALQRLFEASAVSIAAGRELDDFLVARPDRTGQADASGGAAEAQRQAVRGDLLREINRRLAGLAQEGADLGVRVSRVDLQPTLPPSAKIAFDSVLTASQNAEQGVAGARTDANRSQQEADRERDRLLTAARATAAERVGDARARTANISALESRMTVATRPGLLDQMYRDELAKVMRRVGKVTAVDARGGARVILPGASSGGPGSGP